MIMNITESCQSPWLRIQLVPLQVTGAQGREWERCGHHSKESQGGLPWCSKSPVPFKGGVWILQGPGAGSMAKAEMNRYLLLVKRKGNLRFQGQQEACVWWMSPGFPLEPFHRGHSLQGWRRPSLGGGIPYVDEASSSQRGCPQPPDTLPFVPAHRGAQVYCQPTPGKHTVPVKWYLHCFAHIPLAGMSVLVGWALWQQASHTCTQTRNTLWCKLKSTFFFP